MKKKVLTKVAAVIVIVAMSLGVTGALAAEKSDSVISPQFIAIVRCYNNLTLGSLGKLTCEGETEVQTGYIAGVTMELQQYNGGWKTIKTWSGTKPIDVYLSQDWYVASGYSYRLKLTHTALDGSGTVIESTITYSKTVYY